MSNPRGQLTFTRAAARSWWLAAMGAPLLGLLVVPLLGLLLHTPPATVSESLRDPDTRAAIHLSLVTSVTATALTMLLGTPLAYLLARRRFVGRTTLEVLIDLPTVLPPAVAGLALLITLGRNGFIGGWLERHGLGLVFTPAAVVLAQMFVAAPYYIKAAQVGLAAVSRELHEAAQIDGASPWQNFRHVTLPLASRGIVGGAALCWARALGEFGATIIFAGNFPGRTQTMPLAIYMGLQIDLDHALTLAMILLAASFVLLLGIRGALRPREVE